MTVFDLIVAVAVACVPLLAAWIASTVVPWIKARTTAEQRKTLMMLVRSAVRAAEQVFKGKEGETVNGEKLEYAKEHLKADLKASGEKIPDETVIEEYIEAAVLELHVKQDWSLDQPLEAGGAG